MVEPSTPNLKVEGSIPGAIHLIISFPSVFRRQRCDRRQRPALAFDDRPSGPGQEVDQEHGEGKQPQHHQIHRSRHDLTHVLTPIDIF